MPDFSNKLRKRLSATATVIVDYTKAEGNLLKIVYLMGLAVEESPEIYKDISTKDHLPKLKKNATTMDRHIYHIMNVLSKKK